MENGFTEYWGVSYALFGNAPNLLIIIITDGLPRITGQMFMNCDGISTITIPNSVTSIGPLAFQDCVNLTTIVIPDSVTVMDGAAFARCEIIETVVIPDSVVDIGNYAFNGCNNLTIYGTEASYAQSYDDYGYMLTVIHGINIKGRIILIKEAFNHKPMPYCERNLVHILLSKNFYCF